MTTEHTLVPLLCPSPFKSVASLLHHGLALNEHGCHSQCLGLNSTNPLSLLQLQASAVTMLRNSQVVPGHDALVHTVGHAVASAPCEHFQLRVWLKLPGASF